MGKKDGSPHGTKYTPCSLLLLPFHISHLVPLGLNHSTWEYIGMGNFNSVICNSTGLLVPNWYRHDDNRVTSMSEVVVGNSMSVSVHL